MKRKATELTDGPIKDVRGVMEVIAEQWPYRQQLPLEGFEHERSYPEKLDDGRVNQNQ